MPMLIENENLGYWAPAFAAVAPPPAPVAPEIPAGKVAGLRVRERAVGNQRISEAEFGALLNPVFRAQGFEVVGTKLVVDDNTVWRWVKAIVPPQVGEPDVEGPVWQAVVASGPFAGYESSNMSTSAPTMRDTAELPRYVEEYTVLLRPTSLERPEGKVGPLNAALRDVLRQLRTAKNAAILTSTSVVPLDAPKPKSSPVAAVLGSAAIIGFALTMSSLGTGRR
jgi:hypothetical protein